MCNNCDFRLSLSFTYTTQYLNYFSHFTQYKLLLRFVIPFFMETFKCCATLVLLIFILEFCHRLGPRQIRAESCLLRPYNTATGAAPFESLMVADIGDIPINTYSLAKTVDIIHKHIGAIAELGCKPLVLGGDHTITYPILQGIKVCIALSFNAYTPYPRNFHTPSLRNYGFYYLLIQCIHPFPKELSLYPHLEIMVCISLSYNACTPSPRNCH